MTGENEADSPRFKNLRVMALSWILWITTWFQLKVIRIFIEMKFLVLL
jgi:hypothetical protein